MNKLNFEINVVTKKVFNEFLTMYTPVNMTIPTRNGTTPKKRNSTHRVIFVLFIRAQK